jgi:ribose 5-phosphate isomerase A
MERDEEKRAAAETAAAMVDDGMVIGLGTGSTAHYAIEALIRRVRGGLRIRAIPTSERSATQARDGGIPLTTFAEHRRLDLTIDGADEIELGTLNLIKGLGGALLREKIVASVSARLVIVADHEKLVERLGTKAPVPVEVVPFGWETTADRLRRPNHSPAEMPRGSCSAPTAGTGSWIAGSVQSLIPRASTARSVRRSEW